MEQERTETVTFNDKTRTVLCNSHCHPTHTFDPTDVCLCRCDCGREMWICKTCLVEGLVTSCGECS
jgi:hypothetical protein